MRGKLGFYMAMMMASLGGMSMPSAGRRPRYNSPLDPPRPRQYTEEQRKEQAQQAINAYNAEKLAEFKTWNLIDVGGIKIAASNVKNAHKTFRRILAQHGLQAV